MPRRRSGIVAGALVLAMAVAALWWFHDEPFTKEKWERATPEMRDRLLLSLARSGILVGLTELQVYDMLGEPDGSSAGRSVYHLADGPVGRCEPGLVLEYSADDVVRAQNLSCMGEAVSETTFDAEAWRTGDRANRLSMARDLLAQRVLIGKRRDDVHEFLGKPDRDLPSHSAIKIWYTRRYYENGEIKKRYAGLSRCLYIHIRNDRVEKAEFVGS